MTKQVKPRPTTFPFEVCEKIFSYLYNDDLLTVKLVCHEFHNNVNQLQEKRIWKSHFHEHRVSDAALRFVRKAQGTMFGTCENMSAFLNGGHSSTSRNPFAHQKIIVTGQLFVQFPMFASLLLRSLTTCCGNFIMECAYDIRFDIQESIDNFAAILRLENLNSLTIWSNLGCRIRKCDQLQSMEVMCSKLSDLTVLGDDADAIIKALPLRLKRQIRHLHYDQHEMIIKPKMSYTFSTFSNLQSLKIRGAGVYTLEDLASARLPLKQISVKLTTDDYYIDFGVVLRQMSWLTSSLEALHMEQPEKELRRGYYLTDCNTEFPKVTNLRIPYRLKDQESVRMIARNFPNVKQLQLLEANNNVESKTVDETLTSLWELVPATTTVISIRQKKPSESNPDMLTAYKYSQTRT